MGWCDIALRLPKRMRTRSPTSATSGAVAGKARLLMVNTLKSVISFGLGRLVPGVTRHSLNMRA